MERKGWRGAGIIVRDTRTHGVKRTLNPLESCTSYGNVIISNNDR